MIALGDLLDWYRTQIPQLLQIMSEQDMIRQLKTCYNLPDNLMDVYFQYRDRYTRWMTWGTSHALSDINERMGTDYYTPMFLLYLFQHSDVSTMEAIPRVQFSMTYVPNMVDKQIFGRLHDIITSGGINLQLPFWMTMIKRHAYLANLYMSNQFGDFGWLISDDDEQVSIVENMANATYLNLRQRDQWGYYIPERLLQHSGISETERIARHNIIIYEFAKKCSQRKLWDIAGGALLPDPNWTTEPKMGKVAAQMLFQSLLWCRLNYAYGASSRRPTTLMGMIADEDQMFIPTTYSTLGQTGHIIATYELKTCQRLSQWANQITSSPYPFAQLKPYLGDGSLVSRVTLEPASLLDSQTQISGQLYDNQYVYSLSYHMSVGLIPYWMSSYLRSLPRPRSPFVDTIYAGLIDVGPLRENFNPYTKNWRAFSKIYVPIEDNLYWSTQAGSVNTMSRKEIKCLTIPSYGSSTSPITTNDGVEIDNDLRMRLIYPRQRLNHRWYPDCFMFSGYPDYPDAASDQRPNPISIEFEVR